MNTWSKPATDEQIATATLGLEKNNITVFVVDSAKEAREKVQELLPQGAEVMNMTSVTLDTIGVSQDILESGKYDAVKKRLMSMSRETESVAMKKLGAAPVWAIGSVNAVTQDGDVVIASNTGSQLSAYAYGSPHVIWVVGAQKIVKDLGAAMERVYEYVLPLEAERAQKAYGAAGSNVSKLLIVNREVMAGRITMIIVKKPLGF